MKHSRLAQRKLNQQNQKKVTKKPFFSIKAVLGVFLFIFILLAVCYLLLPSSWSGKSKIAVSVQDPSGDVKVVVLDPPNSSIYTIIIPGATQVDASNELGSWKLESITRLGQDKKLGGDFLKNTLIKSFNFPIDYWASDNFLSSLNSGPSNFSFMDKIKILLFSVGVGNNARIDVNLTDSGILERSQLIDTSLGWTISNNMPAKIKSYFAIVDSNEQVLIKDATGDGDSANMVAKTLETLGVNIASVQQEGDGNIDCKITGLDQDIVVKIASIFTCTSEIKKPGNNFDIEIDLGAKFKNRF